MARLGGGKSGVSGQFQHHPRITQDVGLDVLQREELRHTFVVGAQQLVVDVVVDGNPIDLAESVPSEELHLEGQAEKASYAEVAGAREQSLEQQVSDALTLDGRVHSKGPHLREVLPQHVQSTAANYLARRPNGNEELLHVLIERDRGLVEQDAVRGVLVDQTPDRSDVAGARRPDVDAHTIEVVGQSAVNGSSASLIAASCSAPSRSTRC